MFNRHRYMCVLAAMILVASFPVGVSYKTANAAVSESGDSTLNRQSDLLDAASALRSVSLDFPAKYGSITFNSTEDGLVLYWINQLPPKMQSVVDGLKVPVDIRSAGYSEAILTAEARRLISLPPEDTGRPLVEAGPLPDASGLRLVVDEESSGQANIPTNIPYTLSEGPAPEFAVGRWNDTEQYRGGAVIERLFNTRCSTAFTVVRNGQRGVVSASHCAMDSAYNYTPEILWFVPGTLPVVREYGRNTHEFFPTDSMFVTGKTYQPRTYVGPWDSTNSAPVRKVQYATVGSHPCTDGGFSGQDCANTVLWQQQFISFLKPGGGRWFIGPGFWTDQNANVASVGHGDSGGPVFFWNTNIGGMNATGMVDAVSTDHIGPCRGVQYNGRVCSSRSFHVNMGNIISGLNVNLVTIQ